MAITAIVPYVAWQAGMVYQRKAAMRGNHVFVLDREEGMGVNPVRALLGDELVRYVYIVPLGDYRHDSEGLTRLFPEAKVQSIENRRAFD